MVIDKSTWADGPWKDEPDEVRFRHYGYECYLIRHPAMGAWWCQVAIPPSDPLFAEIPRDRRPGIPAALSLALYVAVAHGGLVALPGVVTEDGEEVWVVGFDCAHCFDLCPGPAALPKSPIGQLLGFPRLETYRTLEYARQQTEKLAEQLRLVALGVLDSFCNSLKSVM
jgi:hypothetical protein